MEKQEISSEPVGLGDRIINVFTSPSEAFQGIPLLSSKTSLWLGSFFATIAIGILVLFLISSNETLKDQMAQLQSQKIQEQVDQGRISQEQADQQIEVFESMGTMFVVFGSLGVVLMSVLYFFGASLVLWLAAKLLMGSTHSYTNFLGMYGIAAWIGILGGIVTVLMMLALGSFAATPSAALLVFQEFNPTNTIHSLLSKIDAFAIWQAIAVGIGLSKITEKPTSSGLSIALVLWGLWVAASVGIGGIF